MSAVVGWALEHPTTLIVGCAFVVLGASVVILAAGAEERLVCVPDRHLELVR